MPGSEGVLEVKDGEDEAEELSQGHHQSDRQRGALSGQNEHTADADISEKNLVKVCNKSVRKIQFKLNLTRQPVILVVIFQVCGFLHIQRTNRFTL